MYFSTKKRLALSITFAFISSCGGGGGGISSETETPIMPPPATTYSVSASFIKGPVTGANCEVFEVSVEGSRSTSISTGQTVNGLVDFGDDIEYQGTGLISCSSGTYTDEATGLSLSAPTMRAVVHIAGNSSFVVSPLTEIAVQVSGGNLNTALTTHNTNIANAFGLDGIDISGVIPTDLNSTAASNNDAGQYATILALTSQFNEDDARSLETIIGNLAADLADGSFPTSTLESFTNAEENLANSAVSSNLSASALATVTASAGIPDPDIGEGGANDSEKPNILFIMSDDQGIDASAEYGFSINPPNTPIISALADEGVIFQNVWSSPACAPTRAAILTGKFGVNNGVLSVPGDINEEDQIIHEFLAEDDNTSDYSTALIGKWHLGSNPISNPIDNGIPYFAGSLTGNLGSYDNWLFTEGSSDITTTQTTNTEYNTSKLTDLAEDWIADQDSPWMLMLAYSAPHTPLHWPDESLHTQTGLTNTQCTDNTAQDSIKRQCFLAAIEAMDTEIGRLLDSMTDTERENTVVIFVGDNGTPNDLRDPLVFANRQVKGTLFEGGVRVPMVVSGAGVSRTDVVEDRLVTVTDLYATIAELAGSGINSIYDSLSFAGYLSSESGENRQHAYSDYSDNPVNGWTVRNSDYQLINNNNVETLYELNPDNFDNTNVTNTETEVLFELQVEAAKVRNSLASLAALAGDFSMLDITEGGFNDIFTTRASTCARFVRSYTSSNVENVANSQMFNGALSIDLSNDICTFETNDIPNHDMQREGDFANPVSAQNLTYRMTASPEFSDEITELNVSIEQGVFLNGVKIDIFAAACIGIERERTGCGNEFAPGFPLATEDVWRFDPMFNGGENFNTDINNAHTQPSGAYHYHGNPNALFDQTGNSESGTIGFAADGFPIFGSYIQENGAIKKVSSSYQVKQGNRPVIDVGGSSDTYSQQPYDGTFRQDYEYVEGTGDLDECNGMMKDGTYGYYVTDGFPYVLGCYKGAPDSSF